MQSPKLSTRVFDIRGRSIHSLEKGTNGPVMVHGWLDNANTFVPLLSSLENGLAIDLPGHGFSQWRGGSNEYHFVDWLTDLHGIVEDRGAPVDLIGHSLGGAICVLYAGLFPDHVRRVALIDSLGPLVTSVADLPDQLRVAIARRFKNWSGRHYKTADQLVDARMAGLPYLSREGAALLAQGATKQEDGMFVFSHDPALKLKSLLRLTEDQVQMIIADVICPVLLIRPESGFSFPDETYEARSSLIRNFTRIDLPGHHHVHLDAPETVAPLLQRFFAESD